MNLIRKLLISKKEFNKVIEQYKEFFNFCNQYGYVIYSYDVSVVPNFDLNNHRGIYYAGRKELTTDYIRVEIIFKRSADFVSIGNTFKQKTGHELPIPPDLIANQIIGFSVIRVDSKEDYHQYYKVNCLRFGVMRNGIKIIHYQIFENKLSGHDFDLWYLNLGPFNEYSNELFYSAYNNAINKCVSKLCNSIKYYNESQWGDDWYIGYMKKHHPEIIPNLSESVEI